MEGEQDAESADLKKDDKRLRPVVVSLIFSVAPRQIARHRALSAFIVASIYNCVSGLQAISRVGCLDGRPLSSSEPRCTRKS